MAESELNTEVTEDLTDEKVDSLLEERTHPSSEVPLKAEAPVKTAPEEYELTIDGKTIKANMDKLKQWASMGYGAPRKIGELNTKLSELETQMKTHQGVSEKYKPVEEYIQKNPSWWDHVQQEWQKREQFNNNPNDPVSQKISQLEKQLQDALGYIGQDKEQKQQAQIKAEDSQLDQEVKSIQKEYKDLDWNGLDENGNSLEFRVLKHAHDNGIKSFKTAFRDYLHDQLLQRAQKQAKLDVTNEIQKTKKLGLLGKTSAPLKGLKGPRADIKSSTYESLLQEALEEIGQARQ